MPIQIDTRAAAALSPRLDEALTLVVNEFDGLDGDRQYRNAFARVLKPDPLRRVPMLGTDQRDLFVPAVRRLVSEAVPPGGHVLDLGGGDGQTFALLADRLPAGTRVSVLEPNAGYAEDYLRYLQSRRHLDARSVMVTEFDRIDACESPPPDGSVDLVLALHMLYFLADPGAGLVRMARFLRAGAALCVVVADETHGYTGLSLGAFLDAGGEAPRGVRPAGVAQRESLLTGALLDLLATALPGFAFELDTHRQPSRLYGHTLADIIALSAIAELAEVAGTDKFRAAAGLLRETPAAVDLRIEDDGPRKGMWSVAQPQYVAVLRRAGL